MIDYKQTKAPKTTITRDLNELTEKVGNVYETVAIIGKRSNHIAISQIALADVTWGWIMGKQRSVAIIP